MIIKLDIKDDYIDVLAKEYGYSEKIQDPIVTLDTNGNKQHGFQEIENPLTKGEFIAKITVDRLVAQVRQHYLNVEAESAREKIAKSVKPSDFKIK